jgi:hypothetical protein
LGRLDLWVGGFFEMIFSNGNVLAQNRFFHAQQHKPADVLALFDETRHLIQETLEVQVYRYPEKDPA